MGLCLCFDPVSDFMIPSRVISGRTPLWNSIEISSYMFIYPSGFYHPKLIKYHLKAMERQLLKIKRIIADNVKTGIVRCFLTIMSNFDGSLFKV